MSARSTSSIPNRKKKRETVINQCINWYIMALEDNAASTPKIFVDNEPYHSNQPAAKTLSHVHFKMTNEGSPQSIKYKLNFMDDEALLSLQQLIPTYPFLRELRFEFCSLTHDQMLFIHIMLQEHAQITYLSVNGNPKSLVEQDETLQLPLHGTRLKVYSAQLCKIDKTVAQLLYVALGTPDLFSRNLVCLNIGCNQLGDEGCIIIAKILRGNRTLQTLNISENCITEEGLIKLLEVFSKFLLSANEIRLKRNARFSSLIKTYFPNINKYEGSPQSSILTLKPDVDAPHHSSVNSVFIDTLVEEGQLYCIGNNSLVHLNIAYNNITINVLEALIESIKYQKQHFKSGGLQSVIFDCDQHLPDLKQEVNRLLCGNATRTARRSSSTII